MAIPVIVPNKNNSISIFMFSFMFLFILNSINIPAPAFTNNPAINEPKAIISDKYNSVIITDEAQFGINPISAAIIGSNIDASCIIFFKVSSPTIPNYYIY